MAFTDDLALLPNNNRAAHAKGLLPPMARMIGHLMFILANCAQDDTEQVLTPEEAQAELQHAKEHWDGRRTDTPLSTATTQILNNFDRALTSAIEEYPDWDNPTRVRNLRDLGNRVAGLTAILDRELLGFRDSDAGTTL